MFRNWLKVFLYNSLQNKLFFLLTIFGLAIGMTGVILALLYWKNESAYNQDNPHKDNIAEVIVHIRDDIWHWQVATLPYYLKEKSDKIEDYMCYKPGYSNDPAIYQGKNIYLTKYFNTQSNFFDFFPLDILSGSAANFKSTPKAMAVEEKQVLTIFGSEDPIGKIIQTPQGAQFVVTTVYKNDDKSAIQPNFIIKEVEHKIKEGIKNSNWGDFNFGLLLKMKNMDDAPSVEKQLKDIFYDYKIRAYARESGENEEQIAKELGNFSFTLVPLLDSRLKSSHLPTGLPEGKGNATLLTINIGLSLLILILSVFNYVNLSTAYAVKRAKEIGVRKVVGASRINVVLQHIVETCIVTLIAILISLAFVELLLPYYNLLLNKKLTIDFIQYIPHFTLLLVVVILLAGVFPALYISNFEILKVLKGNFSRSTSGTWLKNIMVVLQFTIATFFIIGGIIISQQVKFMSNKDLGFHADQIVSIGWDKDYGDKGKFDQYLRIKQELAKIPGVTDINTAVFTLGIGSSSSSSYTIDGETVQAQNMGIDFGYLPLFGIKIVEGRDLNSNLASDSTQAVLVNKAAMQAFGTNNILGKEISVFGQKAKIIGVVDDFHLYGLNNKIPPMVFTHIKQTNWAQTNISTIVLKIKADQTEQALSQIESYWKNNVDNSRPFNFEFIDKIFARTYYDYVKQRNLFGILNIIVISIALLGLFALASYSIERRYKEISIKKVLGISTMQLISNLSTHYLILFIIGYALAVVPSIYAMNLWLSNFSYRIDIPVTTYLLSFLLMFALTAIVVISKAYHATRISALTYLKYE
jgi:putative ABC transport system permease protein